MDKLIYSGSPHVRASNNTRKIMLDVIIALMPACIVGCVFFGLNALFILIISVASAVLAEMIYGLCCRLTFSQIIERFDFTSIITGLLIGMNFPAFSLADGWYVPILTSFFAIIVVKMLFGGTGKNLFNPAIAGRIFAIMSFGALLNYSLSPAAYTPLISSLSGDSVVTGATPLTLLLNDNDIFASTNLTLLDLFLGTGLFGTIGETCKAALLLGGIYLVIRKVIKFEYPLTYIVATGLFTVVFKGFDFSYFLPSILSGGLFLGAVFMATDYVTTPNTWLGNMIYFLFLGLLNAVLRVVCKMETTSFAIMLGNCVVPLIDMYILPKPFGAQKVKKSAKGDAK